MKTTNKIMELKEAFLPLVQKLKINREKVPMELLKTKYKKGYAKLCLELGDASSAYAKALCITGFRIHKDYTEEGVTRLQKVIDNSGILKKLRADVYEAQDISAFESHCMELKKLIQKEVHDFCMEHIGLILIPNSDDEDDITTASFSTVNRCALVDGKWIPLEQFRKGCT